MARGIHRCGCGPAPVIWCYAPGTARCTELALPPPLPPLIRNAELTWDDSRLPRSTMFGDIYFSAQGPLEESRHVFLAGNDLPGRWQHNG